MNSKCVSIIMLLIIVFLLILLLMSKINKKSDTETFQTSVPNPALGELPTTEIEQKLEQEEEKSYQLHEVFTFLKELKLPKELASRYAHTLRASDPYRQEELDSLIETALNKKFILDENDLKSFQQTIDLKPNGLIGSLDYYRSVIDFIKLTDAIGKYHKEVRNGLVNNDDQ